MTSSTKVLPAHVWQRMILRWTDLQPEGEVKLLAAAAGAWIHDEHYKAVENGQEPHYGRELVRSLGNVCAALGIDFDFMLARLDDAWNGRGHVTQWMADQRKAKAGHSLAEVA